MVSDSLSRLTPTLQALLEASDQLHVNSPEADFLTRIVGSGLVRPMEHELIGYWYAQYLSIRQGLWDLINDCLSSGDRHANKLNDEQVWAHFVIGYSAACLLIRNDQHFLFNIANHSVLQRKFNEAFAEYRIPRKQYTRIFSAFVDGNDALRIYDAIHDAKKQQRTIQGLHSHPVVGEFAKRLPEFESWLNPSKRTYFQRLIAYISHKWRRKSIVVLNNLLAKTVERVGRAASEIQLPLEKRVSVKLRQQMLNVLEPGDILVTRHDTAFTNLFLPGFWPHAALYVGTVSQREALGVNVSEDTARSWRADRCVLEALKDGVRFRPINETLAVDNFIVLKPNISRENIKLGIERVVRHEGKLYNFDFDFFSADRLVCSEVVYRAFDGLGGLYFPLTERAGRQTLSPEDLVRVALGTDALDVVGIYGVDASRMRYTVGTDAERIARSSIYAEPANASTGLV